METTIEITTETPATETMEARKARLAPTEECTAARLESLRLAHEAGVSDELFSRLCRELRVSRQDTIVLPFQRFELLSRGKGWARKGRGTSAVWGEREDNGYRVGPGKWTVGGSDGFSRKGEDAWTVQHVTVGAETWTVAS